MPTLILPLPDGPPAEAWPWLLVDDTGHAIRHGDDAPAQLPPADRLVLVPAARSVTWLRTTLPAAAPKRWRAALPGLLEEQLLDEPDTLLLALPAQAQGGQATWVASAALAPLQSAVAALEAVQRRVDAIAPLAWPTAEGEAPQGHVIERDGQVQVLWRDAAGVSLLPLAGGFARSRVGAQADAATPAQWTAEPAAVAAAEQWLGHTVAVRTRPEQLALALQAPWNLCQGDLAPRLRGVQALQHWGHRLMQPAWRPLRWGVAALLVVQLIGLNALAWQQHRQEQGRRQATLAIMTQAFPGVPGGEVSRLGPALGALRAAAGVAGADDLDPLLAAAARHWPQGLGPVQALDFEAGRLTLAAPEWRDELTPAFGQALAAEGIQLQQDGTRLVLQGAGGPR